MRERSMRIRGGDRYRLEVREDDGVAVVVLAFGPDGQLAGKARALRHRHEPAAAEVHLTLIDAGAGSPLGRKLLDELRGAARAVGIDRLTGRVVLDDGATQQLLVATGAAVWLADPGVLAFELPVRRPRTVPPVVAQRRQLGRLAS
jgi:L-amino acid N-acyltransferase YncA